MSALENIANQPVVLSQMNSFSIAGHNARGILAPVLDHGQGVIDRLIGVRVPDDADYAAHQPCLAPKSDISIFIAAEVSRRSLLIPQLLRYHVIGEIH